MKDSALIPILLTLMIVFSGVLLYVNGVFGLIDTKDKETFAPTDPCGADNLTPIPVSCVATILSDLYQKQAPPPASKTPKLMAIADFMKLPQNERLQYANTLPADQQVTLRMQYNQYMSNPK
jgi:hypothetical protein